MSERKTYLFEYSRNPVEFLFSSDTEEKTKRWFERNGHRSLNACLAEFRASPAISRVEVAGEARRHREDLDEQFAYKYQLALKIKGNPYLNITGYGHGQNAHQAKTIALAEALERLGCGMHNPVYDEILKPNRSITITKPFAGGTSSNGACFHSQPVQVLKGAICELLERDAFLTNWYSDRALPVSKIGREHPLYEQKKIFDQVGWDLNEHRFSYDKVGAQCVMISLIRKKPGANQWNFFLGGGASGSYREAADKAFSEARWLYRSSLAADFQIDTGGKVSPSLLKSVRSRIFLYQRPHYIKLFQERFRQTMPPSSRRRKRTDLEFVLECLKTIKTLRIIPLPVPIGFQKHVFCIKVTCEDLQDIDWELPPRYNSRRIRTRYRTPASSFNKLPHPIG